MEASPCCDSVVGHQTAANFCTCHECTAVVPQNYVAITVLESRWEWNEISIKFELRWKTVNETGPSSLIIISTIRCRYIPINLFSRVFIFKRSRLPNYFTRYFKCHYFFILIHPYKWWNTCLDRMNSLNDPTNCCSYIYIYIVTRLFPYCQ